MMMDIVTVCRDQAQCDFFQAQFLGEMLFKNVV